MNKPFDQLKYIRQSTSELAKTASESKEDFGDGDRYPIRNSARDWSFP